MKVTGALSIILFSLTATGTQIDYPPLTRETLVGSWEAITIRGVEKIYPDQLWHLEVGKKDTDAYLVEISPDKRLPGCVLRELVSARLTGENIELHFARPIGLKNDPSPPMWIVGRGFGSAEGGIISGSLFMSEPSSFDSGNGQKIFFVKGTWTRDLGEASKAAEEAVKRRKSEK